MEMDIKTLVATASGAAVTLVVGLIIGGLLGVFNAGSDALTEEQIKKVMSEILVTPQGNSFGAEIDEINRRLTVMETTLGSHTRTLEILTD